MHKNVRRQTDRHTDIGGKEEARIEDGHSHV